MDWEIDRPKIVSLYFDCINSCNENLYSVLDSNKEKSIEIYQIIRYITDRVSTVWLLTQNDKLWDADIIDRSVLETLLKLMFIVKSPSQEEQVIRLREYWNDLGEINSLKRSEKSKEILPHFEDEFAQLAHKSIILSEEKEQELKAKWNRKDRKKIAQKWSFSEIVFTLIRDYQNDGAEMLVGLFHEYGMCSHIAHGDETGIGIIEERKNKPHREREAVHRAHFIKLLSNCLAYSTWTAIVSMEHLSLSKKFYYENLKRINEVKELSYQYQKVVFDDSDYDKLSNRN